MLKNDKDKGLEYISTTGKIMSAKAIKSSCLCGCKCNMKFSGEQRNTIFTDFDNRSSNFQNQLIAQGIEESDKQVQRVRNPNEVESRQK